MGRDVYFFLVLKLNKMQNLRTVSTATKKKKSVFPKLKVFNINNEIYTDRQQLKQAILDKNSDIYSLVENGSIFDVLLLDKIKHTAIVKVSL